VGYFPHWPLGYELTFTRVNDDHR